MTAEDELAIPEVPQARPEDLEDVSWALSTAEAMWARGEHLDGIKWVRTAAEAASDAEDDARALELAKAASELTGLLTRRSRASVGDAASHASGAPPEATPAPPQNLGSVQPKPMGTPPPVPGSSRPGTRPPPVPKAASTARSVQPVAPGAQSSRPSSAPQASRPSSAPQASRPSSAPQASRPSSAPRGSQAPRPSQVPQTAPRPLATKDTEASSGANARKAGALDTAPQTVVDSATATRVLHEERTETTAVGLGPVPGAVSVPIPPRSQPEPTVVTSRDDLVRGHLLAADDSDHIGDDGDRKTAFAIPSAAPISPSVPLPAVRPAAASIHDPQIQTSQAVRVVVWRDGNGVHLAPAGTVVSAITIDAVLVALEPSADLTAWLSKRER
jgi:hypothetical protein